MTNYIYGTLNIKNNIVGVNQSPELNADTGLIMQLNPQNITAIEYQNTLVGASSNTADIHETVAVGWYIAITSGPASGNKKKIIGVSGFTITVETPWTATPNAGDSYDLFKQTAIAMIFKPSTQQLLFGYTNNSCEDTNINVYGNLSPQSGKSYAPIISSIRVNNVSYATVYKMAWNISAMTASSASVVLDVSGVVDFSINDGITTYASASYASSGSYILSITLPVSTTLLQFQVRGNGNLNSGVLIIQ